MANNRANLTFGERWRPPAYQPHTNCWCERDVARCSLPDCPRDARMRAEAEEQAALKEKYEKLRP